MDVVVVLELCQGQQVSPVILPLVGEQSEILLQLLVNLFRLSVSLRMVGRSGCNLDSEHPVKLSGEFRNELRSTVGHYLPRYSVMPPDLLDKQMCSAGCRDCIEGRHEMGSFGDGVHYHHYCIVTCRVREFGDKVHADCVPWCLGDWQGVELSNRAAFGPWSACIGCRWRHISQRIGTSGATSSFETPTLESSTCLHDQLSVCHGHIVQLQCAVQDG